MCTLFVYVRSLSYVRSPLCFLVAALCVREEDSAADQDKGDQVLKLQNIFLQNQRAEDAGKDGLGEFDNKQLGKLAVFHDSKPDAVADNRCRADVRHNPKLPVEAEGHAATHCQAHDQEHRAAEQLGDARCGDGGYLGEHLFADDV